MGQYDKLYKEFLSKLRKARVETGLTQKQVAELLQRPQSYISKSESGERRIDIVELTEFARVYNKPLDYFVEMNKGLPGQ
jgi:transcriptional regulator with XRE-family HTH domain